MHVTLVAVAGYLVLVALLRVTGPRTMSKMTPLDFVLAVTLGSAFGRTITASDVSLIQALYAVALMVGMQCLLTFLRSRSDQLRRMVDHPPVVLYEDGQMMTRAIRRHRLIDADVHEAARKNGKGSLADVHLVLLLRDGSLGVISKGEIGDGSSVKPYVQQF